MGGLLIVSVVNSSSGIGAAGGAYNATPGPLAVRGEGRGGDEEVEEWGAEFAILPLYLNFPGYATAALWGCGLINIPGTYYNYSVKVSKATFFIIHAHACTPPPNRKSSSFKRDI